MTTSFTSPYEGLVQIDNYASSSSAPVNGTVQFTVYGWWPGNPRDLTSTVQYTSSNPTVGTISNSGLFTGKSSGATQITASLAGVTSNMINLTVYSNNATKTVKSISAGGAHSCVILSDSTVKCWGYNDYGQLGNGTNTDSKIPVFPANIDNAISVSASKNGYNTCVVLSDGTIKCWGYNEWGQLGNGTDNGPDLCGDSSDPLQCHFIPITVSDINNAADVVTEWKHTCALLSDGSIKCWGGNSSGKLGNGTTKSSNVPTSVDGISNAIMIALGHSHSCALLSDGTVKCWGDNSYGQLGVGIDNGPESCGTYAICSKTPIAIPNLTAVKISAADTTTCALLSDGTVKCWGGNFWGDLGVGLSNGPENCGRGNIIGLPNPCSMTPISVLGITTANDIDVGQDHTCAVLSDTSVRCWGLNRAGQLGSGTSTGPENCNGLVCSTTPQQVNGLNSVVNIHAGGAHTCVLLSNNTVSCWGANGVGNLGMGAESGPEMCQHSDNSNFSCSTVPVAVDASLYASATRLMKSFYFAFVELLMRLAPG